MEQSLGGSTIASMIHRFRTGNPTDPGLRKKKRVQKRLEKEFWWKDQAESFNVTDSDDEEDDLEDEQVNAFTRDRKSSFGWMDSEAAQGARRSSLDDLIARDVEEYTNTVSKLDEVSPATRGRRALRELELEDEKSDSEMNHDNDSGEEIVLGGGSSKKDTLAGPEQPNSPTAPSIEQLKKKIKALEQLANLEETIPDVPMVVPTVSASNHSSVNEMVSDLETLIYSFSVSHNVNNEEDRNIPKATAPVILEKEEDKTASQGTQVNVADHVEYTQKLIRSIASKARKKGDDIAQNLYTPSRVSFYEDNVSWSSGEPLEEEEDTLSDEGSEDIVLQSYHRTPHGKLIRPTDIQEDLNVALLRLNTRLKVETEPGKKQMQIPITGIGSQVDILKLKEDVSARLRTNSDDLGLPPLPSDFDSSINLLTARLRLANNIECEPSRLQEQVFLQQLEHDSPAHRALHNAFNALDWNEDGLITVQDARKIIEEHSRWANTPVNISDEHVLRACGLLFLGTRGSSYLSFPDLVKAFEILVPYVEPEEPVQVELTKLADVAPTVQETSRGEVSHDPPGDTEQPRKQSAKVGSREIRQLAAQLRRTHALIQSDDESTADSTSVDTESEADTQVPRYPGAQPTRSNNRGPSHRKGQPATRPPPFNPQKMYFPSAPTFKSSPRKVNSDEVVLKKTALQSAVQNATIQFYKKRLEEKEKENIQLPVFYEGQQNRQPVYPPTTKATEQVEEESQENLALENYEFDFDGRRLKVRGNSLCRGESKSPPEMRRPYEVHAEAGHSGQNQVNTAATKSELGGHFEVHQQR
eukprot:CAMPEP_0203763102 /NCGR_PEP_ID=MMETSP0098-20131031/15789_1 /ASSEMBLY_ACC=CAM_ASM_000208 /TAXON_ID=96639 /ORGANISM=" , Strain NY0313808BC1" /LENGTH=811 /DNA_ID=CAMNT_0050657705 /DNA_START=185 /DNA_END=2617 /DNA_ORIENTATION=+